MKNIKEIIQTEIDAAYMYRELAAMQEDAQIKSFYEEMAKIEEGHRDDFFKETKAKMPSFKLPEVSRRAKILVSLSKRFGENILINALLNTESSMGAAEMTKKLKTGHKLSGSENRHLEILKNIQKMSGSSIGKVETQHRNVGGNALRAAVLGANDGLVSNMSLVMGVAGASPEGNSVIIAGVAGLLAGAISMALGEWISVKSSQELYERQMEIERYEVESKPEEEKRELVLLYKAKGLNPEAAEKLAEEAFKNKDKAHIILVNEELGINLEELNNSPWEAAIASFILFVVGAIIPLFPFFITTGFQGILWSMICSTIGLFGIGAAITLITARSWVKSGFRQVIFGLAAAAVTYGIGRLVGATII